MEIYNNPTIKPNIPTLSSPQQGSYSNSSHLSSLEQSSAEETVTCCEHFYQSIVSCFTSIINWIKSFFSRDLHELPPLGETKNNMLPERSKFQPLSSPPSAPIIKSEDIIRIHALSIESELILVCFKPGKPFFLDEEDADVRVMKGDAAWDTVTFNDGLDEDLKKKLVTKVIQAIQKTNIKLLFLPTFCQSLVPPCDGLEIKFSDPDSF